MTEASVAALSARAATAFEAGLCDGFQRRRPRSTDSVMMSVMEIGDRWHEVFQRRMRAIYLAGYHIAKARRAPQRSDREAAQQENGRRVIKDSCRDGSA